jgi:hypothetical protein
MTAHKAIAAFLTGLVGVIAMFIPSVQTFATPEIISAVTALVTAAVVWFVPNKPLA